MVSERGNNVRRFIDKMLKLMKIFIFAVIQASVDEQKASDLLLLRRDSLQ